MQETGGRERKNIPGKKTRAACVVVGGWGRPTKTGTLVPALVAAKSNENVPKFPDIYRERQSVQTSSWEPVR